MSKTILLVEDDANDVYFMKRAAREAGILDSLSVAQDGQEAMDYLGGLGEYADRQRFPLPCLVLLDLKLPRVMGFEVLKWIRQQPALRITKVIVLTSSDLKEDIDLAHRLGANSYLVKPPTPEKLKETVARIKQYWLDLNRPAPRQVEHAAWQPDYPNVESGKSPIAQTSPATLCCNSWVREDSPLVSSKPRQRNFTTPRKPSN